MAKKESKSTALPNIKIEPARRAKYQRAYERFAVVHVDANFSDWCRAALDRACE
jgi:hypothetical protein